MSDSESAPPLSIIIVSWNVRERLAECLKSLNAAEAECPHECLVIDCASEDDSAKMVAENFPKTRLFALDENIGFVRANNLGLGEARGEYFFLLNPDTLLTPGTLAHMLQELAHEERVGILGPQHRHGDGRHQSTRRRFPDALTTLLESTWLQPLAPKCLLARYRYCERDDDDCYDVDWVQGSALLTRRALWEEIGGLDEHFVMYYEEVDWCQRARAAGWRVRYCGAARITHYGGASSEQVPTRRQWHFDRSKLRYARQYQGLALAGLLFILLRLGYILRAALEACKWLLGHKRPLRRARLRAYRQLLHLPLWRN